MYQYHKLPNGLRIIFHKNESLVTHAGVFVNVGSRDESVEAEGVAHFIEHSIFKGTEHRRSYHIRNRIDGVGGELDAFTTKEETCIYASVLSQHLDRCLELFSDILFHSTFPANEIEKEKDVVIEEINLYKDAPADLIFDEFEERMFGNHPLAHNILGTKRNVKRFGSQFLQDYTRAHYTADRMVVSVVGNVDFARLVRMCEKYFSQYPLCQSESRKTVTPTYNRFEETINRRLHQVHMLIGCPAPDMYDVRKTAFTLLNNIIGGPAMNSRLNVSVREKHGFCYTIESQYVPFTDAGLFYVYAGVDSDAQQHSTDLVMEELRHFAEQPLSPQQLRAAKQQFVGQMAITNEQPLNEMQSIGKAYLNFDHVDTLEEMTHDIMAVTAEEVQSVARQLFVPEKFSFLYYK